MTERPPAPDAIRQALATAALPDLVPVEPPVLSGLDYYLHSWTETLSGFGAYGSLPAAGFLALSGQEALAWMCLGSFPVFWLLLRLVRWHTTVSSRLWRALDNQRNLRLELMRHHLLAVLDGREPAGSLLKDGPADGLMYLREPFAGLELPPAWSEAFALTLRLSAGA